MATCENCSWFDGDNPYFKYCDKKEKCIKPKVNEHCGSYDHSRTKWIKEVI